MTSALIQRPTLANKTQHQQPASTTSSTNPKSNSATINLAANNVTHIKEFQKRNRSETSTNHQRIGDASIVMIDGYDVLDLFGMHEQELVALVNNGDLTAYRFGNQIKFRALEIARFAGELLLYSAEDWRRVRAETPAMRNVGKRQF